MDGRVEPVSVEVRDASGIVSFTNDRPYLGQHILIHDITVHTMAGVDKKHAP
jgi:hypothetical protein